MLIPTAGKKQLVRLGIRHGPALSLERRMEREKILWLGEVFYGCLVHLLHYPCSPVFHGRLSAVNTYDIPFVPVQSHRISSLEVALSQTQTIQGGGRSPRSNSVT